MLFVGNDQGQILKFDVVGDDGVGADQQVKRTVCERGERLAALFCGRAARNQARPYAEARTHGGKGFVMLDGQHFRRRHERRLQTVFRYNIDERGGYRRLAAANIALNQAIHADAACEVAEALVHSPALRACELKSGGLHKGRQVDIRVDLDTGCGAFCTPKPLQRGLENEQLFKHQPLPRQLQRVPVAREVDVAQGISARCKLVFHAQAVA